MLALYNLYKLLFLPTCTLISCDPAEGGRGENAMFEEAAMNGAMGGLPPLESGLLPGGKSSLLIYKVIMLIYKVIKNN